MNDDATAYDVAYENLAIAYMHGASGVCTAYIPRTRGDQHDSMAYEGRVYSALAAYMPNL